MHWGAYSRFSQHHSDAQNSSVVFRLHLEQVSCITHMALDPIFERMEESCSYPTRKRDETDPGPLVPFPSDGAA